MRNDGQQYLDRLRRFYDANPELNPAIKDALQRIDAVFGFDTEGPILSVIGDPGDTDSYLTIGVVTNLPPREAIDRLHQIDDGWLKDIDAATRERILITLVMRAVTDA